MKRDLEPQQQPPILEGEIIAPGPSANGRQEHEQAQVHVIKMGWFGKTIAILVLVGIFAAAILLAAGALLIMLPIAIIGSIWGWWRIRKHKRHAR